MWETLTDGDFFRMRLITALFFRRTGLSLFGKALALPSREKLSMHSQIPILMSGFHTKPCRIWLIQGDPNQIFPFQMTIALKISTSNPMLDQHCW